MIINSPAKLNLYLDVLEKRRDGYHNIRTVFERISLFDKIIIKPNKTGVITIRSDSRGIPTGRLNLVYRAASLLKKDFGVTSGVKIEIRKRIPVGAGLGGGSSNAASTLVGLNKLWNLSLNRLGLVKYAEKIGSDVAFFLYDKPFALGLGRGEVIEPLNNFKRKFWHILIIPNVKVSTKEIYRSLDRQGKRNSGNRHILTEHLKDFDSLIFFNRLEEITFRKYPKVKEIRDKLQELKVKNVLMSGSGSAVFGIVDSRKEGLRLAEFFKRFKSLKVFVVRTT